MELNIHPILPEERICMGWHSHQELNERTGCIGYLTANLNASAPEFESSWRDRIPKLNIPEFTDDFNDMMDTLRQEVLRSPAELRAFCAAHPDSFLKDSICQDRQYGFRIDTGRYSHLLVCSFHSTDCRLRVNAFSFLALDRQMREARNGVPILDRQGHERFRMPDGGKLRAMTPKGFSGFWTIRYLDPERAVCSMNSRKAPSTISVNYPNGRKKTGFSSCLWIRPCEPAVHRSVRGRNGNP